MNQVRNAVIEYLQKEGFNVHSSLMLRDIANYKIDIKWNNPKNLWYFDELNETWVKNH